MSCKTAQIQEGEGVVGAFRRACGSAEMGRSARRSELKLAVWSWQFLADFPQRTRRRNAPRMAAQGLRSLLDGIGDHEAAGTKASAIMEAGREN